MKAPPGPSRDDCARLQCAYYCLAVLPGDQIGCLYERDDYHKITFARCPCQLAVGRPISAGRDAELAVHLPSRWKSIPASDEPMRATANIERPARTIDWCFSPPSAGKTTRAASGCCRSMAGSFSRKSIRDVASRPSRFCTGSSRLRPHDDPETELLDRRVRAFLVDNLGDKRVVVRIAGVEYPLAPRRGNGHFYDVLRLPDTIARREPECLP